MLEDSSSREEENSLLEKLRHHSSILETSEDTLESDLLPGKDIEASEVKETGERKSLLKEDGTGLPECTQCGLEK